MNNPLTIYLVIFLTLISSLLSAQNSSFACSGSGNDEIGGFNLCFNPDDAVVALDRNQWFSSAAAPPGAKPSEAYGYNFPPIESVYPCVDGLDVEDVEVRITINSFSVNFPPALACCESYISGLFANLYGNCAYGTMCPVIGDGLTNVSNPGTGDCSASGDQLLYDPINNNIPLGLPYTSTISCLSGTFGESQTLGIDIFVNFIFENAAAGGCTNCPQDVISQGYVTIDFDVVYEYIYCSEELGEDCRSINFDPIGPVCDSDGLVTLPSFSLEGIAGTWSPSNFLDVSASGGTTVSPVFTPSDAGCFSNPVSIDIEVDECCTAEAGNLQPNNSFSICSDGGEFIDLQLAGLLDPIVPRNFSVLDAYHFLLVDDNGVIIDNSNNVNNLNFPANTGTEPVDYCVYGLSYKIFPGLGTISNGTTTINLGSPNVIQDGAGNDLTAMALVPGSCMDLSSNCVMITVEVAAEPPMVSDIDTCEGGDTEIIPTGNGTNFNFYSDASLMTLLSTGSSYDPAPAGGTTTEIWVTEGSGDCQSAATMLTITIVDGADPGTNNSITSCTDNNATINLFTSLGGMPETGGSWTDVDASGVDLTDPTSVDFSNTATGMYDFTYTIPATGGCPEVSATVTIDLGNPVNAGMDNSITLCNLDATTIDLFDNLNGTPEANGNWTDVDGSGLDISDPSDVDLTNLGTGTYDFSYELAGQGSCSDASATLTLEFEVAPDAGMDGTANICEGGNTVIDLVSSLNGTPDQGGTWEDLTQIGVDLTDPTAVDFAGIASGDYLFTYLLEGTLCDDQSATVTVSIGAAPSAGTDGFNSICNDGSFFDLFNELNGSPDNNGTWSDDDAAGVDLSNPNNVNFDMVPAGDYDFTYSIAASGDCPSASATVTITVEENPNAGTNGMLSYCKGTNMLIDIFNELEDNPDTGGIWSDDDNSTVDLSDPTAVDFENVMDGSYDFTYQVSGDNVCQNAIAIVTIEVTSMPNFGSDNSIRICEGDGNVIDFFTIINAAENPNGTWTDNMQTGLNLSTANSVDVSMLDDGTYTYDYEILGTTDCPGGMSTLTLIVEESSDAGTSQMAVEVCDDETTTINLFDQLMGADAGGTWSEITPSSTGFDAMTGTFDLLGQAAATYTFEYSFPAGMVCNASSSEVTIVINENPVVDLGADIDQCIGDGSVMLDAGNNGANFNWTVIPDDGNNGATNQNITLNDVAGQTTIQVNVSQGNCTGFDEVIVNINELPTLVETTKDCSADLSTYTVSISSMGNSIVSDQGSVTDNMNGTFTISGIPSGIDANVQVTNNTNNCENTFAISAPDCACPTIAPAQGVDVSICFGEPIPMLSATADAGLVVNWYSDVAGANLLLANSNTYTPVMPGTFYVEAFEQSSGCPSVLTPINFTIDPLPTFAETDKGCSTDLSTYDVELSTDGNIVSSSDGNVIDNGNGSFSISGIMAQQDIVVTIENSLTNCSNTFNVTAPDCACPTITPAIGNDVSFCEGENIPTLSATAEAGLEINWYEDAAGTNLLLANSNSFTPTMPGTFYAEAFEQSSGCPAALTAINLVMNPLPTFTESDKECSSDLTTYEVQIITDGDIVNSSLGNVVDDGNGNFSVVGITADEDITITVENSNTNCSNTFTVVAPQCDCPTIAIPTSTDVAYCEGDAIPTLNAIAENGLEINWYGDAAGTDLLLASSNSFQPTMSGTFYAEAFDPSSMCNSSIIEVNVTANPLPTFVEIDNSCSNDLTTYNVIIETDDTMLTSSLGTVVDNADGTFTISDIPADMDVDFSITNVTTNCSDDFSIQAPDCDCPNIDSPVSSDVAYCIGDAITPLEATAANGFEINWYADANGDDLLMSNSTTFTPAGPGTFYVEAFDPNSQCNSALIPVAVDEIALPTYEELDLSCSSDLSTYFLLLSSDANEVTANDGVVVDNMDGTFTINDVPIEVDLIINLLSTTNSCSDEINVIAPDCACPNFDAPIIQTQCDDASTAGTDTDDTFSYSIEVNSIGLGNTYNILGDDSQTGLTYGSPQGPFGNFLISEGSIVIEITDDSNPNCNLINIQIDPPASCSECMETADAGLDVELNCSLTQSNLNATASSPGQFNWTGPNGFIATDDPNPIVTEAGLYTLEVLFENGCTASDFVEVTLDPATPLADAGLELNITCDNPEVILGGSNSSQGSQYEYLWTGPNNFTSTEQNPIATIEGTYSLIVTDTQNNCVSEMSTVEVIDLRLTLTAEIISSETVLNCENIAINLEANVTGNSNDAVYTWSFDGNEIEALNFIAAMPGVITLTVTDPASGCSNMDEITITQDIAIPTLNIPVIDNLDCVTENVLIDLDQPNPNYIYEWFDAQGNSIGTADQINIDVAGEYLVVIMNELNGCTNSVTFIVQEDFTQPDVAAGDDLTLDCNDMQATLNGSSSNNNVTIDWTTDDGGFVTGVNSFQPIVNAPGLYILTVTDEDNGCTNVSQVLVGESDAPTSAALNIDQPTCLENGNILIGNVEGGMSPYMYSIGNGTLNSDPNFSDLDPNEYIVSVEDANGCLWDTMVVINPNIDLTIDLGEDTEINFGDSLLINPILNVGQEQIDQVNWMGNQTISCDNCLNPYVTPTASTTYTIEVIDEDGCIATDEITIIVRRDLNFYIPNVFSPNVDGINDVFTVFPGSGITMINRFQVLDRWGEEMYINQNFQADANVGWDGTFRGKPMQPGIYIYIVEVEYIDGTTELFKGDFSLMR